jgi:hypothetical protein
MAHLTLYWERCGHQNSRGTLKPRGPGLLQSEWPLVNPCRLSSLCAEFRGRLRALNRDQEDKQLRAQFALRDRVTLCELPSLKDHYSQAGRSEVDAALNCRAHRRKNDLAFSRSIEKADVPSKNLQKHKLLPEIYFVCCPPLPYHNLKHHAPSRLRSTVLVSFITKSSQCSFEQRHERCTNKPGCHAPRASGKMLHPMAGAAGSHSRLDSAPAAFSPVRPLRSIRGESLWQAAGVEPCPV